MNDDKHMTDRQLQRAVMEEIARDPRIEPASVGVEVCHGVVTLTGAVPSWAHKHLISEAAHRVTSVHDVANDVEVRPSWIGGKTDTEIAAAIRHALSWDSLVAHDRIHSTVENGLVTLTGWVSVAWQREEAARAIRNIEGIRAIDNQLAVQPAPATDAEPAEGGALRV